MIEKTVLFLHGFASSAQGVKAQYLGERLSGMSGVSCYAPDLNPTPEDFEYMTVTGMINRLRQVVLDRGLAGLGLVGSSMGALVGLHYAHRFGGVDKMLLLAPALAYRSRGLSQREHELWQRAGASPVYHYAFERQVPLRYDLEIDGRFYQEPVAPAAPTLIIHGQADDVIPIEESRRYAAAFPGQVRLVEVEASHPLNDQLDLIWGHVQSFLLA